MIERPRDAREVAAALERADRAERTVRPLGAGHSFSEAVLTSGTLLSLDAMTGVLDVDRSTGLVRVEAGIRLGALNEALDAHGLALENLGDVDVQSIAGATATGTHGTGGALPNLSAALHSVEMVLADGSSLVLSEARDPEGWRAARVSLGALGVVTAVTLRTVPAFNLEGVDATSPLDETLQRLEELVAENDHFELYTFPHSPLALTRTNNRTEAPAEPRSPRRAWLEDVALRNHLFRAMCELGRRRPSLVPRLNALAARASGETRRVDRSHRIFASPRLVRFTETEWAVPRAHAVEAVRAVKAIAERGPDAVPFPIEVRFVAADDALLSPAAGRDTCYVAAHMLRGMEWRPYFGAVEEAMVGLGGRPHWGKRHFRTAATLRDSYPDWGRFQALRARLDPRGRFANAYVERVLGPLEPA